MPPHSPRVLLASLCLVGALVPGGCTPSTRKEAALPRPAPKLTARDSGGRTFDLAAERGKVVLVTFGYTSCPDVCPTTLSKLRQVSSALGERLQVVFVTVDPVRDTAPRLEEYVRAFDERFRPVRLSGAALGRVLAEFGVTASRQEASAPRYRNHPAAAQSYSIDHTGAYFVVDAQGQLRLRLAHDSSVEQLVSNLRPLLAEATPLSATVHVESARAQVTPAGLAAVYLRLVNSSDRADQLLEVVTSDAEVAELHETVSDGEVLRMQPRPDGFLLPERGTLSLEPGGKHVMLHGVRAPEALTLKLRFRHALPVTVVVPRTALGVFP